MKVLITGYGRMGRLIEDTLVKAGDEIAGWIDIENVAELDSSEKIADIIMDFSNPSLTDTVVAYAARTGTPFLSGTTNMTPEQHESLAKLAQLVGNKDTLQVGTTGKTVVFLKDDFAFSASFSASDCMSEATDSIVFFTCSFPARFHPFLIQLSIQC